MIEPGVYVTFFDEGEPFDRELPPIGPLVSVVSRSAQLVAERKVVEHSMMGEDLHGWIEAELEYQRACDEDATARRNSMRLTAPSGIYLRFATFGDTRESMPQSELGPFAIVVVHAQRIEADGTVLATRPSPAAPWELTEDAGVSSAGVRKSDVGFRAVGSSYHPSMNPQAPRAAAWPTMPALPAPA